VTWPSPRAYCKAEARNFADGHEQEDWLAAEQGKKTMPASVIPGAYGALI